MPTVRYTVVDGEVIAEKRGGTRRQYVPDPLGSTVALRDSVQATDTFANWPYGEERSRTGTTNTPFRFVGTLGYYRDSSALSYVRARYLLASLGRWLTKDPIWFLGGSNWYKYCGDGPGTWVDPEGLQDQDKESSPPVYQFPLPVLKHKEKDGRTTGNVEIDLLPGITIGPGPSLGFAGVGAGYKFGGTEDLGSGFDIHAGTWGQYTPWDGFSGSHNAGFGYSHTLLPGLRLYGDVGVTAPSDGGAGGHYKGGIEYGRNFEIIGIPVRFKVFIQYGDGRLQHGIH
jgi:RHS repeat-associated protein